MGWISDDCHHEGYFAPVLNDGAMTSSSNAQGPVVMVRAENGKYTGQDAQRSDDEVVGWRVMCDCSTADSFGPVSTWEGQYWERAATQALEDVADGRIFVGPEWLACDIDDREDVEQIARACWLSQHVAPAEAIDGIVTARSEVAGATARLDQAVAYARASGKSWADIGRAAGMSRQAAHERWG